MIIAVSVPRKVQTRFKHFACRMFPNEALAFIIGHRGDGLVIVDIWYPPLNELRKYATPEQVDVLDSWHMSAMEYAAGKRCIVLGNIHTHTYPWKITRGLVYDPVQSIGDVNGWSGLDLICGVANVAEGSNGRKKCSDIAFWGPQATINVTTK
jgi:hypothetical protein